MSEFARDEGITLMLTKEQAPRMDVLGRPIPPCCPSWVLRKPA